MQLQIFEPVRQGISFRRFAFGLLILAAGLMTAEAQVLGDTEDVSRDFQKAENVYFIGNRLANFEAASGTGQIVWERYLRTASLNFNKIDLGLARGKATEFPATEYDENP